MLVLHRAHLLACFAAVVLTSCGTAPAPEKKSEATPPPAPPPVEVVLPPEIPRIRTTTFTSKNNKTYTIETVADDREEALRALPAGKRDVTPMPAKPPGDTFRGTARKAAKLSIANAPMETFNDVQALIATLPSHASMVKHNPLITTTANSNRVAEEKRNIKLKAWLYAASREDDNDYHLIVGRAPNSSPAVYMTVELSGLPPASSASFAKLKAARNAFKEFFGGDLPGDDYRFYNPPVPVDIEGSLFFDMSHASGSRPSPQSLRPKMPVVWELHPITSIVLEP